MKLLVTGGESMIGQHISIADSDYSIINVRHSEFDLCDPIQTRNLFQIHQPQYVIHLATYSGNIQFNQRYPADTFYRTSMMALNVLKCCADFRVEKVLSVLSSCAIADKGNDELKAEQLWDGLPNPTIECHGLAKRNLHAFSRQIYRQFGIHAICAILNNSFGPYDSFSIDKTKVVGGMIKRFVEAKEKNLDKVVCWGSGFPKREFIYAYDAAKLLLETLKSYNDVDTPLNIESRTEVTIKELAEIVAKAVGYTGKIEWDTSKPDGQMRKKLDSWRMTSELFDGWTNRFSYTPFEKAIQTTVDWYIKNKNTWTK